MFVDQVSAFQEASVHAFCVEILLLELDAAAQDIVGVCQPRLWKHFNQAGLQT